MPPRSSTRDDTELRVVVLGGHAVAIERVLRGVGARPGYAVLVVGPPPQELAALLRGIALPIERVTGDVALAPDRAYLLSPDHDVSVRRGQLLVGRGPSARPPLDMLLRAVADDLGRDAAGVILAGAGTDGAIGIKRLKEAGGLTIAQADALGDDAAVPRDAIATGLIDLVVGIDEIASKLQLALQDPADASTTDPATATETAADTLRDILALVRIRSGHDFASYKRATLFRRVSRRMQVCNAASISAYHRYLRDHPAELSHLLRDFLISVTNFFRDAESFRVLADAVLPRLFAEKRSGDPVRVWVAGCATGEEAYSVAMLLVEQAEAIGGSFKLQVFATDIDDHSLAEARAARYPDTIDADVSPERLARFFTQESGGYRVSKELRELVLFSPHNVLRDPPFSRLDLVTCRNLLIYLNREAQDRTLHVFHFGLPPGGCLFLGSSETAENSPLFESLDAKHRIFVRRATTAGYGLDPMIAPARWRPHEVSTASASPVDRPASVGELHHRVIEQLAPPSVLVNSELDVLHVSEHAVKYMAVAPGEPSRQILRLVIEPLRIELRAAIYAARQEKARQDQRVVRFEGPTGPRTVELRVYSTQPTDLGAGSLLVTFAELDPTAAAGPTPLPTSAAIEPVVREMEDELQRTRDQLRTTIEQYETSLEELKASNEELQAINEELRSATEELETGREELQSVNEELSTLNQELKLKIEEVSRANSDLQNLMTSTEIGVLFLDRDLRVQRYTPRAQEVFNIIPSDLGRPLAHITHRLEGTDLPATAAGVLQSLRTAEQEATAAGKRYLVRVLPYRSIVDRIEGVVITLIDVSVQRQAIEAQSRSEERLQWALISAPLILLSFDAAGEVTWAFGQRRALPAGPVHALGVFTAAQAAVIDAAVRATLGSGTAQRLAVDVQLGERASTYEFRVERSREGATAVGFEVASRT